MLLTVFFRFFAPYSLPVRFLVTTTVDRWDKRRARGYLAPYSTRTDETADSKRLPAGDYYTSSRTLLLRPDKMAYLAGCQKPSMLDHILYRFPGQSSPAFVLFLESGRSIPLGRSWAVEHVLVAGSRSRGRPPHLAFPSFAVVSFDF